MTYVCMCVRVCAERHHGGVQSWCSNADKWFKNNAIVSTSQHTTPSSTHTSLSSSSSSKRSRTDKLSRRSPYISRLAGPSNITATTTTTTTTNTTTTNNTNYNNNNSTTSTTSAKTVCNSSSSCSNSSSSNSSSSSSSCLSSHISQHPSHVPPAVTPPISHLHNTYSPLLTAALEQQQQQSTYHHSAGSKTMLPHNPADTSIRISLPVSLANNTTLSSTTSSRNTSRCSSSNSMSHGSNSTISNNLELGITNGVDFNSSSANCHTAISPVLEFPSASPCSLSKDDEDSLDSRLRALHSPTSTPGSSLLFSSNAHSSLSHHLSLPELPPDSSSILCNSSHYNTGQHSVGGPHSASSHVTGSHSVGPSSVGPSSVGPPSVGPSSVGPPSVGPPSVGPPSIRPPSIGPPSVGPCNTLGGCSTSGSRSNLCNSLNNDSLLNGSPHNNSRTSSASTINTAEEEVNRISAMLQKEAEALSISTDLRTDNNNLTSSLSSHDFVEAQGLSGRGHLSNALNNRSSNLQGLSSRTSNNNSVPLNIASHAIGPDIKGHLETADVSSITALTSRQQHHNNNNSHIINCNNSSSTGQTNENIATISTGIGQVPVETLNQIQADLLATVSESDLNAVLNATPDASLLNNNSTNINNNILGQSNNSSQVYFSENTRVEFRDSSLHNSANYDALSLDTSLVRHHCNGDQLNVLDNSASSAVNTHTLHYDGSTILEHSDQLQLPDLDVMSAQSDELTSAVNSITQPCQNGTNSSFDSQLSSFLLSSSSSSQSNACSHLQQHQQIVSSPAPSPSPSITVGLTSVSPLSVSSASSLQALAPITIGPNVQDIAGLNKGIVTSQPITVVIGGSRTPITLPQSPATSLAGIVKKNSSNVLSARLSNSVQSSNINVVQSPLQNTTPIQNSIGLLATPPHTTPSPKKSSKKKKGNEARKVVPLKDREYNPEKHCGVLVTETGKPCTRSLTCKTHSLTLRRAVNSRSKKFDDLLLEHKNNKLSKPLDSAYPSIQVSYTIHIEYNSKRCQ